VVDAAILPVKRLDRAKRRLAADFDDEQRVSIARALLEDALDLCERSAFFSWWVVSDDPAVLEYAEERGLATLRDEGSGLNDALAVALTVVKNANADTLTVVPADIPLAQVEDLRDLLDTGATSDVVVVPSERDGGTNGLHVSPPENLIPRFGTGSLAAHLAAAEEAGLRCSILSLEGMSLDIDTAADVEALLLHYRALNTKTGVLLENLSRGALPKPS
jgi:2-phospho-L-lactate guanylyltransferase